MSTLEFLECYGGQSLEVLIALEPKYRVDSLVLAIESALERKLARVGLAALSREERIVIAVEALERGQLDTLIASHALSVRATLVTNNQKHHSRVSGLKMANWL